MGLAETAGSSTWRVRQDFENVLRAMQRSADRQKILAAHGVLMSDERLPLAVLDLRRLTTLEGRILVHGEEDAGRQAGRSYLMLPGTDAQVHYVYYTPEMEGARGRGGLVTNSFVRLRKLFAGGHPVYENRRVGRFVRRSCATSGVPATIPCNASSGEASFRKKMAGMDGLGVIRKRLRRSR